MRAAVLRAFPVAEVWGIGPATTARLAALGVGTAARLAAMDPKHARRIGTVALERAVLELRGLPCLDLELVAPARKSLAVTRSFGRPVTALDELREAVAAYAARAGEKLRAHGLVAGRLSAFFHTSAFRDDGPRHHGQRTARLVPMTADTRALVAAAGRCVEAAWRGPGFAYAKAGVLLDELCPREAAPPSLFAAALPGSDALMAAVDRINARFGRGTLFPAAIGVEHAWAMRAAHRTPRYTTCLDELPVARA